MTALLVMLASTLVAHLLLSVIAAVQGWRDGWVPIARKPIHIGVPAVAYRAARAARVLHDLEKGRLPR